MICCVYGDNIQAEMLVVMVVVGLLLASYTSLKVTTNRWPQPVGGYLVYNTMNLHICICICWSYF